jgi:hypothetical protein
MTSQYEVIIVILLSLIFVKLFFPSLISKFHSTRSGPRTGAPLTISGTGVEPSDFFSLTNTIECLPGPGPKADYYNRSDTLGGVCGGGQFVNDQIKRYKIVDDM